jgi:hypothetical protein
MKKPFLTTLTLIIATALFPMLLLAQRNDAQLMGFKGVVKEVCAQNGRTLYDFDSNGFARDYFDLTFGGQNFNVDIYKRSGNQIQGTIQICSADLVQLHLVGRPRDGWFTSDYFNRIGMPVTLTFSNGRLAKAELSYTKSTDNYDYRTIYNIRAYVDYNYNNRGELVSMIGKLKFFGHEESYYSGNIRNKRDDETNISIICRNYTYDPAGNWISRERVDQNNYIVDRRTFTYDKEYISEQKFNKARGNINALKRLAEDTEITQEYRDKAKYHWSAMLYDRAAENDDLDEMKAIAENPQVVQEYRNKANQYWSKGSYAKAAVSGNHEQVAHIALQTDADDDVRNKAAQNWNNYVSSEISKANSGVMNEKKLEELFKLRNNEVTNETNRNIIETLVREYFWTHRVEYALQQETDYKKIAKYKNVQFQGWKVFDTEYLNLIDQRSQELRQSYIDKFVALAQSEYDVAKYGNSITYAEMVLAEEPEHPKAKKLWVDSYYNKALYEYRQSNFIEAIEMLNKSLSVFPDNAEAKWLAEECSYQLLLMNIEYESASDKMFVEFLKKYPNGRYYSEVQDERLKFNLKKLNENSSYSEIIFVRDLPTSNEQLNAKRVRIVKRLMK